MADIPADANLTQTQLWKAFAENANDEQRLMVGKLADRAGVRLDLIFETFPTYTLHSRVHAVNVVRLMGDLLGPSIKEITALEGAVLILSAYLHDIGMVFTEVERAGLADDDQFEAFLNAHAEARLRVQEDGEVSTHTAEWYCRWAHPTRVRGFLQTLGPDELSWGVVSLTQQVRLVCESHGSDAGDIKSEDGLDKEFLGEADLKFCAILLRLADILDFDNSRSPEEVYKHLGLAERTDRRKQESDVEWRKHMVSGGFRFPGGERPHPYTLRFISGPDDPGVEYDLRAFLATIDDEVRKCRSLLDFCSDRWRKFILPDTINRDGIVSKGYKYGEHRFTLDKDQVLDLLMGESLYSNRYVFVRELLQNALDASRHREFYEHSIGNADFKAEPINVTTWTDDEGCQWVRFDDYGMGMDEEIIEKFLLKVGKSYYQSPEFEADVLGYEKRDQGKLVPISRFGIGILSCFIAGDRVEVNTRRVSGDPQSSPGIRLSMSSARQFYTMCTDGELYEPAAMPCEAGEDKGYRPGQECGTSIAVRIDPARNDGSLDVREELERHVAYPEVPVRLEGVRIGGDYAAATRTPWCAAMADTLNEEQMAEVSKLLLCDVATPITIRAIPLDLTAHSAHPQLAGQAVLVHVEIAEGDREEVRKAADSGTTIAVDIGPRGRVALELSHAWSGRPGPSDRRTRIPVLPALSAILAARGDDPWHSWLTHNGLRVPHKLPEGLSWSVGSSHLRLRDVVPWRDDVTRHAVVGSVALADSLRPDVSLSRAELRRLPWELCSALTLTAAKALSSAGVAGAHTCSMTNRLLVGRTLADLLGSTPNPSLWASWESAAVVETDAGLRSVEEIRAALTAAETVNLKGWEPWSTHVGGVSTRHRGSFLSSCVPALLQLAFTLELDVRGDGVGCPRLVVHPKDRGAVETQGLLHFPPLTFVRYEGSSAFRVGRYPANITHPFVEWLLRATAALAQKHAGRLSVLARGVATWRGPDPFNNALAELRAHLDSEHRPPAALVLTDDDFVE